MLEKKQPAPEFAAVNQKSDEVKLSDFKGKKNVVLYFYPKDDTPGCTIEANDFTKLVDDFSQFETTVIGVSKDSCESHVDFIEKFGIKLDLLADTEGELCQNYDVWREKEKNGVKKMAIFRSTFIIDKEGNIVEAYYGVDHNGHAKAVLDRVKQLHYRPDA
jgi:thioredoxin-dependent peroxiredoxin